jgi:hypothetical protein
MVKKAASPLRSIVLFQRNSRDRIGPFNLATAVGRLEMCDPCPF